MRHSETWTLGNCDKHGKWGVSVERLGSGDEPKVSDECPQCRKLRLRDKHETLLAESYGKGYEDGRDDQEETDAPSAA